MADTRTRAEKLLAMALQDDSPHERDLARARLAEMGQWPPPPPPPAPPHAPAPQPFYGAGFTFYASSTNNVYTSDSPFDTTAVNFRVKGPFG